GPPTIAVLPSAVPSATLKPNSAAPDSPPPSSFACWVQVEPERVKTHAAPFSVLFLGPPISAVLPLGDSATLKPWSCSPNPPPLPTSLEPCWRNGAIRTG